MATFFYILLAIVILLLMVIIHEFGHYIAGKILKFKINEFSVGFGPKLFSKKKKNGEVFSLRLIPLGGYCAFEGETDDGKGQKDKPDEKPIVFSEEIADTNVQNVAAEQATDVSSDTPDKTEKPRKFLEEKPYKRIIVLIAGGVFNLLSAVVFSFLFILIVGYPTPKVTKLYYQDAAQTTPYCNLCVGDEIIKVNGKKIGVMHSFEDYVSNCKLGDSVTVTVIRNGVREDIVLTVKTVNTHEEGVNEYSGFGFQSERIYNNKSVGGAFKYCIPFTAKLSVAILVSFFQLITGKLSVTTLTGPVGTVSMMADVASANWRNIFILLPLIAANLGLFNLLPIPALDGSKVIFTLIEWIRGKPVNRTVENYIHVIGLLLLMVFVVAVDIVGMVLRR